MKTKKGNKNFCYCGVLFSLIFLIVCFSTLSAFAYTSINEDKPTSLTIDYDMDNGKISDASFRLYLVDDIDAAANMIPVDDFIEAHVDLSDQSNWTESAITLESFVVEMENNDTPINPVATGVTDNDGSLTFSGLEPGLYLLVGDAVTQEDKIYTPVATLVTVPYLNDDDTWDYNPTIRPVAQSTDLGEKTVDVSVEKVWADEENESQRPNSVKVTLYENGVTYDCIELSSENSWRYTWRALNPNSRWQLVENNVPDNYTVATVLNDYNFVVTNTYAPTTTKTLKTTSDSTTSNKTTVSTTSDVKTSNKTTVSAASNVTKTNSTNGDSDTTSGDSSSSKSTLPKTGQRWIPIMILIVSGILLFIIGFVRRIKSKQ